MSNNKFVYSEDQIYEAIIKTLSGDSDSFEIIYDSYYKMVVSIIRRIVHPLSSELDSLVNESFLLIYKGLKGFKRNSKFSTYIYRIVLHYSFKVSKKRNKDKKHLIIFGENSNGIENIPSKKETEQEIVDKAFLDKAIGSLSEEMQEAIDLYYYDQYSIKEIARITGTTETAIKNRLYQARNKIKSFLPKGVYDE
ncbi:MAG: RNA polymerase sigma factor [Brevinema sp.]